MDTLEYKAKPCSCGYPKCQHWHISGVASVQGVSFDEDQARAVAAFLNARKQDDLAKRIDTMAQITDASHLMLQAALEAAFPELFVSRGADIDWKRTLPTVTVYTLPIRYPRSE